MPFTTIQDRALQIPRQAVPGSQFQKAKFNLGEVHRILPPVGKDHINCQGIDIPPEGKRLQITKELVSLIQAGFVRIAHDIDKPSSGDQPPVPIQETGDLPPTVGVSSHTTEGGHAPPSVFSSAEEIDACEDREKIRVFVKNKTGFGNERAPIEGLRELAKRFI